MPAGVCELGIEPAPVIAGCAPGDVSERLETINEARARAPTERQAPGELCHAHSLAGRVVYQHQHLASRQPHAVKSLHLDIQLVDDECVNLQKPPPSCPFLWGERIGA
jgi:hypothetical protein